MNLYLFTCGCVAVLLGMVHSCLGEVMIFRRLGSTPFVSKDQSEQLGRRQVRILRVSWHLASFFGWGFAAILFGLALEPQTELTPLLKRALIGSFLSGSLLTLIGTKAKHPGWVVLLVMTALVWLS